MTAPFSTEKVSLTSCQGNVSLQGKYYEMCYFKICFWFVVCFCFVLTYINLYKLYTKERHNQATKHKES